jgi:erythromycin esterase-like protein
MSDKALIDQISRAAVRVHVDGRYDRLVKDIGNASIVLLGEATHGSREFYRARAAISRQLITEHGFDAIAVEADWPDALQVSRYVRGTSSSLDALDALSGFERFPLWMWRNRETVELVEWLRVHNADVYAPEQRVGFYGVDLYSLRNSMDAVIRYLERTDPTAARIARHRYSCFDHLAEDPQRYGYAATFGMRRDCENEVIRQLIELQARSATVAAHGNGHAADELFDAQQNARVAQNAEAYYRTMFMGRDESWNLRDTHMADTLDALLEHLSTRKGHPARVVVWAHNSHIGDARATEMGEHGQLNLGQLVRERHGMEHTFLVGFTTHTGHVTAASEWDTPARHKRVKPSRHDSFEFLLHSCDLGDFMVPLRSEPAIQQELSTKRMERAIGVIYLPDTERISHYFHARLGKQFDAVIHFDETQALHPLDHIAHWRPTEVPDTFPSGV